MKETKKAKAYISLWGTGINVTIDIYDGDYEMATFRVIKQGITAGTGKVIDRIPGSEHSLDRSLWLINTLLWEKVFTPKVQRKR